MDVIQGGFSDIFIQIIDTLIRLIQVGGPVGIFFVMIIQALIAPIPSELLLAAAGAAMADKYGTVLGISIAIISASIGSIAGAIICFYIAQKGGRPLVERFIDEKSLIFADQWFERYGIWAILIGRLLPFIPFDAVSYGAGLSKIRLRDFVIPTTIGIIPRSIFYCSLGHITYQALHQTFELALLFLGVVVGLLVLAWYIIMRKIKMKVSDQSENSNQSETSSNPEILQNE
ncbi:MAG: TVP38/TMEM64 family protein [Candidatus Hodarchaeota archaeon]